MNIITPMEPILTNNITNNKDWIHQIKWDGIRGISYINNNTIKIFTKKGNERTQFYPELHETLKLIRGKQAVLDGEIVVFNQEKRPSFSNVMIRERVRTLRNVFYYSKKYPVKYIVFDILYLNNKNLMNLSLEERQNILEKNLNKSRSITITDNFADGLSLLNMMKDMNYEGVVSKKLNSKYISGKKHTDWYKIKIRKEILAVIGGIKIKDDFPISLMVGIYKDKKLLYIGNVSSGLKTNDLQIIKQNISLLLTSKCPFNNINDNKKNITWVNPKLTCWISFLEWTNNGNLRNPKLIGFSKKLPLEANGKEYVYDRNN